MNEIQKKFIVAHLNLYIKINSLDETVLLDIGVINEAYESGIIEEDTINAIEATIVRFIGSPLTDVTTEFIKKVISRLTCLKDKDYLYYLIILADIQEEKDSEKRKAEISDILSRDLAFDDERKIFEVYYTLSNLAIATKDNALIQKAINKVQSLQVKK